MFTTIFNAKDKWIIMSVLYAELNVETGRFY